MAPFKVKTFQIFKPKSVCILKPRIPNTFSYNARQMRRQNCSTISFITSSPKTKTENLSDNDLVLSRNSFMDNTFSNPLLNKLYQCREMEIPNAIPEEALQAGDFDFYYTELLEDVFRSMKRERIDIEFLDAVCSLLFRKRRDVPIEYLYCDIKTPLVLSNWNETYLLYKMLHYIVKNKSKLVSPGLIRKIVYMCSQIHDIREIDMLRDLLNMISGMNKTIKQALIDTIFQYLNDVNNEVVFDSGNGILLCLEIIDNIHQVVPIQLPESKAIAFNSILVRLHNSPFVVHFSNALNSILQIINPHIRDKIVFHNNFHYYISHWPITASKKQPIFLTNMLNLIKCFDANKVDDNLRRDIKRFNSYLSNFLKTGNILHSIKLLTHLARIRNIQKLDAVDKSIYDNFVNTLLEIQACSKTDPKLKESVLEMMVNIAQTRVKKVKSAKKKISSSKETWLMLKRQLKQR